MEAILVMTESGIIPIQQIKANEDSLFLTWMPKNMANEWLEHDFDEITPEGWKWVDLILSKANGSLSKISLRRPLWWLESQGLESVGAKVMLNIPEMGIVGEAEVLAIRENSLDMRKVQIQNDGEFVLSPITGYFEH